LLIYFLYSYVWTNQVELLTEVEKRFINRKFSTSKGTNYAPQMDIYDQACKSSKLWGQDHGGGLYICQDSVVERNDSKCVLYSYGLGADWSFDQQAEIEGCEVCFNFSLCFGFVFAF
jgi:hypothetical protein